MKSVQTESGCRADTGIGPRMTKLLAGSINKKLAQLSRHFSANVKRFSQCLITERKNQLVERCMKGKSFDDTFPVTIYWWFYNPSVRMVEPNFKSPSGNHNDFAMSNVNRRQLITN